MVEARVARLEAAVAHIERDVADIKSLLARLAPMIDRMDGFLHATLPTLATRVELAKLEVEIGKRPTMAGMFAMFAVVIAIAGLPYWGRWLSDLKILLGG